MPRTPIKRLLLSIVDGLARSAYGLEELFRLKAEGDSILKLLKVADAPIELRWVTLSSLILISSPPDFRF